MTEEVAARVWLGEGVAYVGWFVVVVAAIGVGFVGGGLFVGAVSASDLTTGGAFVWGLTTALFGWLLVECLESQIGATVDLISEAVRRAGR